MPRTNFRALQCRVVFNALSRLKIFEFPFLFVVRSGRSYSNSTRFETSSGLLAMSPDMRILVPASFFEAECRRSFYFLFVESHFFRTNFIFQHPILKLLDVFVSSDPLIVNFARAVHRIAGASISTCYTYSIRVPGAMLHRALVEFSYHCTAPRHLSSSGDSVTTKMQSTLN